MPVIPQRELRNNVSEILRRAEAGERFTITVNGRPTAELGPPAEPVRFASGEAFDRMVRETPVDPEWAADLRRMRAEDEAASVDPWDG